MPNVPSIYLDTSVINFLYATDAPTMQTETVDFFENYIKAGLYFAFISDIVLQEINRTKDKHKRQRLLNAVRENSLRFLDIPDLSEVNDLADRYQERGIIPVNKRADALHVAISTIKNIDYLVSWNYQHLANVNRERRILAVNLELNYTHPFQILNPLQLMYAKN